jgi:hypothetical protein
MIRSSDAGLVARCPGGGPTSRSAASEFCAPMKREMSSPTGLVWNLVDYNAVAISDHDRRTDVVAKFGSAYAPITYLTTATGLTFVTRGTVRA